VGVVKFRVYQQGEKGGGLMGKIKVKEYPGPTTFGEGLDEMLHNDRVRVLQYGSLDDGVYYVVYESLHEASPHEKS